MVYIKLFNTEQEKQACTDTYEYLSYTVETDKVNIHKEVRPFFCKLTLNNGEVVEIEGSGTLSMSMTSDYSKRIISAEVGELCTQLNAAFANCFSLTSVTLPNTLTSITDMSFYGCPLSSIISMATTAPTLGASTVFLGGPKQNGTLYVPIGSSGYDVWMQNEAYYLGYYNWTKVEQ